MLSDRREYVCRTIDISPCGVAILGADAGDVGERIVAHFEHLGRIEGTIARQFGACFAIDLLAPQLKRQRLESRIAWLLKQQAKPAPDNRQHERFEPSQWGTVLKTKDGQQYSATIIDFALAGAAISVEASPPLGAEVMLGQKNARIVRRFAGGVAVAFC
jgi:hypothetical protein